MVRVKCLMEFEFKNGKKRLMHEDVEWIEEWCVENKVDLKRLMYWDRNNVKTRKYK